MFVLESSPCESNTEVHVDRSEYELNIEAIKGISSIERVCQMYKFNRKSPSNL